MISLIKRRPYGYFTIFLNHKSVLTLLYPVFFIIFVSIIYLIEYEQRGAIIELVFDVFWMIPEHIG
jgi:hypothetical protein